MITIPAQGSADPTTIDSNETREYKQQTFIGFKKLQARKKGDRERVSLAFGGLLGGENGQRFGGEQGGRSGGQVWTRRTDWTYFLLHVDCLLIILLQSLVPIY